VNILRNEKGVALVIVLLLAVVALIVTAGLLHMLARGGFISGQHKRYSTAVEAARGGLEATVQVVADRGIDTMGLTNVALGANLGTKLENPTGAWGGADDTSTIDPSDDTTYDLRFDLGGYRIHSKIVDTVDGNSAADMGLLKSGVVNTGAGEVTVMNIPFLYTIEELAQSTTNPSERAKISVLYQY
jgi:hypothetical protein